MVENSVWNLQGQSVEGPVRPPLEIKSCIHLGKIYSDFRGRKDGLKQLKQHLFKEPTSPLSARDINKLEKEL